MARGRPVGVVQVAFVLAYLLAGSHAAFGQTGHLRPDIRLALPGINIPGVASTPPASISLGSQGLGATFPGINVAGLVTTNPVALGLNGSGLKTDFPGVNVAGVLSTTPAVANVGDKGLTVNLPGANVSGLVKTAPGGVSLDNQGLTATAPAISGLVSVSPVSVSLNDKGLNATLPSTNILGLVKTTEGGVSLGDKGLKVDLPGADIAGGVSTVPGSITLTDKGANTKLPDIKIGDKSLWSLPGGDVISHVSPITQLFANMGSAEAFASVDQLLNGLAFGNDAPSACAAVDAGALGPFPTADISTWNAVAINRTDHDGYRVGGENGVSCGSTLPFQTTERTHLPGVLWDASSAFGFKKGTFHMGFSGGATDSDTQVKASAALRDAGIAQAGSNRMRAWSVSGFSLLTMDKWYAGSAFGSAWGRTESQNFILGSDSDYETSTFVAAGFFGTIVPLTDTVRFDMRGTLSYQRTVGEAHVDSLGLVYGDHTIAAADAMLSARLFGVFRHDGMTIRPFIQAGITHHLSYGNQLEIDGVAFAMREADTTIFTATGLDFEIDRTLQLSVGVRHDHSPDAESVTGRFGLSLRLN